MRSEAERFDLNTKPPINWFSLDLLRRRRGLPDVTQPSLDQWYHRRYHRTVANAAKILSRMRNSPRDWRIEDLKALAKRLGIPFRQQGTSHVVFVHESAGLVSVPCARPIKPVYIRQFVALIDRLGETL
jgi:hypothetical protein